MDRNQAPLSAQRGPHAAAAALRVQFWASARKYAEASTLAPAILQSPPLGTADCKRLFPRLNCGEGAPEVAAHQALLSEVTRV